MRPNSAAPRHTRMWVRNPAGWLSISRSRPRAAPRPTASRTRSTITLLSSWSSSAFIAPTAPSGVELLERRPRQEEPLLPRIAKPDDGLGLLTFPDHVEDYAFTEGVVPDVVADAQARQPSCPAGVAGERIRHDRFSMRSSPAPDGPLLAEHLDQLLGDLGEEAAGRGEGRAPGG